MTNTLEVRDLRATIGTSQILHGVDLTVSEGSTTAVLGRNGVGKTTLMRSILGYLDCTGDVLLQGATISDLSTHQRVQRGICYVPENRDVFQGLTVAENLRLAEPRVGEARYDLVFDLFPELKQRAEQLAGSLSGGQQQMVSLARGLLPESKLLIIDEPTKGLAPRVVNEVVAVLKQVSEASTILMVEQNLKAASELADDVVIVSEGRIATTGSTDLLADRDELRRYLGVARSGHDKEA
ncbi:MULTISPECIES: ABC transporter ATP-binding protein [unclassified Aeromicrobium]|uniref:ABC transporter ATP-binding protein n=1 Tax=unclassified Aeromicrobium TaxID=2633570 RepID=UPI00396B1CEC